MKNTKKIGAFVAALAIAVTGFGFSGCTKNEVKTTLLAKYTFENVSGTQVVNEADGTRDNISYVFNAENADYLVKEPSEPLVKRGG